MGGIAMHNEFAVEVKNLYVEFKTDYGVVKAVNGLDLHSAWKDFGTGRRNWSRKNHDGTGDDEPHSIAAGPYCAG